MVTPEDYELYKDEIEEAKNDPITSMLTEEQIIESAKQVNALTTKLFESQLENPYNTMFCKISPDEVVDPNTLDKINTVKTQILIEKNELENAAIIFGLMYVIYNEKGPKAEAYANYCKYKYYTFQDAPKKDMWIKMDDDILYIVKDMFAECEEDIFPDNYDELSKKERKFKYPKSNETYFAFLKLKSRLEETNEQVRKQVNHEMMIKGNALLKKMDAASKIIEEQNKMENGQEEPEENHLPIETKDNWEEEWDELDRIGKLETAVFYNKTDSQETKELKAKLLKEARKAKTLKEMREKRIQYEEQYGGLEEYKKLFDNKKENPKSPDNPENQ